MLFKSVAASLAFVASVSARPAQVSQISDGQVQAPPATVISQISDGQIQAPGPTPVSQISDGQVQAPKPAPVTQLPDGQPQAPQGSSVATASGSSPAAPTQVNKVAGQPFSFPLSNGFPDVSPGTPQLMDIYKQAHGTLPNGPLPSKINDTSAVVWSLIAFNEIFEVAYFTDLIYNITNNVPGYTSSKQGTRATILEALTAIQAQEQLHALGANTILKTAGRPTISPCKYQFPVNNLDDALTFAKTFTDLVVGTLQTALTSFGLDGDDAFLALVGSVIGQESQQVAAFRLYEGLIPSALPFLTIGGPAFAASALNQLVVVPGSCPAADAAAIPIPVLAPLTVVTPASSISKDTTTLQFSYSNSTLPNAADLSLVYINQQNVPIVEPLENVQTTGDKVTFTAAFPYKENLLNSLTIASVVKGKGPFASSGDVAAAALFGPGLIEFN